MNNMTPGWQDKEYGIERDKRYFDIAVSRISQAIIDKQGGELFAQHKPDKQADMFNGV